MTSWLCVKEPGHIHLCEAGDTGAPYVSRATLLGTHHTSRPPPWRTPSNSDSTGMMEEATARSIVGILGSTTPMPASRFTQTVTFPYQSHSKPNEFLFQFVKRPLVCAGSTPKHDVKRILCRQENLSYQFSKSALEQISFYGRASMSRYDQTDSYMAQRGGDTSHVEVQRAESPPLFRYPAEFRTSSNPLLRRILFIHLGAGVLARKLHCQPLPAFLATLTQYFSTPFGLHPCPKTMLFYSPLVARTVCWLAHQRLRTVLGRTLSRDT
jgi:hypothetical protein